MINKNKITCEEWHDEIADKMNELKKVIKSEIEKCKKELLNAVRQVYKCFKK